MDENKLPAIVLMSESPLSSGSHSAQAALKLDELKADILHFLINVKCRFGEGSRQLHDVHCALESFRKGELSKRDAHKTILDILAGHNDLRQKLMDILTHPAADWAPGDFDLPAEKPLQSPFIEPAPQFLQPAHQPQMRIPSFSSSWFVTPHLDHSSGPLTFGRFDDHTSMVSSPSLGLVQLQLPQPSHDLWNPQETTNVYLAANDDARILPPVHTIFRNPWQDTSIARDCANNALSFSPDNTYVLEGSEFDTYANASYSGHVNLPMVHHRDAEQEGKANSTLLDTPQLTFNMLPSSFEDGASPGLYPLASCPVGVQAPLTPMSEQSPDTKGPQDAQSLPLDNFMERYDSVAELYIHGLCGKGFATLAGVRKHHWGKRANNLATTTGCWAKHKKPEVAWDEHPSCKGKRVVPEVTRSVSSSSKQTHPKTMTVQPKASAASDLLQINTGHGFPTLDDLPRTVADTLTTGFASAYELEECDSSLHTHRLSSRSSFDDLLTAVNLVSDIDASRLGTSTDSVALQLDAQVAAAEQHTSLVPFIPSATPFGSGHEHPIAPIALDNTTAGPEFGMDRILPTNLDDQDASSSFQRPFKPLSFQQPGPVKKERKV